MKKLLTLCSALCLMGLLCIPASALEYTGGPRRSGICQRHLGGAGADS